ncbi:polymorphic toxin-type HINT domain-containing protein [Amycolatopsis sp. cg5]|uniref:Hint domain-containing protein n=1 Tax=Amycolatopsis sp. cg5 TaxID=3238802 RepID=UPI003524A69F
MRDTKVDLTKAVLYGVSGGLLTVAFAVLGPGTAEAGPPQLVDPGNGKPVKLPQPAAQSAPVNKATNPQPANTVKQQPTNKAQEQKPHWRQQQKDSWEKQAAQRTEHDAAVAQDKAVKAAKQSGSDSDKAKKAADTAKSLTRARDTNRTYRTAAAKNVERIDDHPDYGKPQPKPHWRQQQKDSWERQAAERTEKDAALAQSKATTAAKDVDPAWPNSGAEAAAKKASDVAKSLTRARDTNRQYRTAASDDVRLLPDQPGFGTQAKPHWRQQQKDSWDRQAAERAELNAADSRYKADQAREQGDPVAAKQAEDTAKTLARARDTNRKYRTAAAQDVKYVSRVGPRLLRNLDPATGEVDLNGFPIPAGSAPLGPLQAAVNKTLNEHQPDCKPNTGCRPVYNLKQETESAIYTACRGSSATVSCDPALPEKANAARMNNGEPTERTVAGQMLEMGDGITWNANGFIPSFPGRVPGAARPSAAVRNTAPARAGEGVQAAAPSRVTPTASGGGRTPSAVTTSGRAVTPPGAAEVPRVTPVRPGPGVTAKTSTGENPAAATRPGAGKRVQPGSLGCRVNSFVGGTLVLMADGSRKPIEQVAVGDVVTNAEPGTDQIEHHVVTAVHVTDADRDFVDLFVESADGIKKIVATAHHLFWDSTTGTWTDATDLKAGHELDSPGDGPVRVVAVRPYPAAQRTYNLTVDDVHTFYVAAGQTPVLVHNCDIDPQVTEAGLNHSFDRHAQQWFGGQPTRAGRMPEWQGLIERAARSTKVVPWSSGSAKTWAYLIRVDGKWFNAQFDRSSGKLVTAFVPNNGQLGAMLKLLGNTGE